MVPYAFLDVTSGIPRKLKVMRKLIFFFFLAHNHSVESHKAIKRRIQTVDNEPKKKLCLENVPGQKQAKRVFLPIKG